MKIISWNVNGLRAVYQRNFLEWFKSENIDILCLQEIKLQSNELPPELIQSIKHNTYFNFAQKKGYAGVSVFSKDKPLKIIDKISMQRFDEEGRGLVLEYPSFTLINFYLPHGGRQKENLNYKLEVYDYLFNYLNRFKNKNLILAGDFNIAHQEIDLARPKQNRNNIMFTLEERSKIDHLLGMGFVDTFRHCNKEGNHYTWWPYFANARERNLGWRIDYIFVSKLLLPRLENASILKDIQGSDHCPISIKI